MGNLFLHVDLNSLLTQGVRKSTGQKSESLWSFMSLTAWISSSGSYLKYKWIHPNSLNILPANLSPVPVPQNICYWFQVLSESHEIIGWGNDGECLSEWGRVPHLLTPGPTLLSSEIRGSGLASPLTCTLKKSTPFYQPPEEPAGATLLCPTPALDKCLIHCNLVQGNCPKFILQNRSAHPTWVDWSKPMTVLFCPFPLPSILSFLNPVFAIT